MERFDEDMKKRAAREDCPVPAGFGERLAARLEELPGRRTARRPRVLRTALIAACACLLLAGTAFAASPELREMVRGVFAPAAVRSEDGRYHQEILREVEKRPAREFAPGVRKAIEGTAENVSLRPESWQAVQEALGVPLLENPLLDESRLYAAPGTDSTGYLLNAHAAGYAYAMRSHAVGGVLVECAVTVYAEGYADDGAMPIDLLDAEGSEEKPAVEDCQLADGTGVKLISYAAPNSIKAWFVHDGAAYLVSVGDWAAMDRLYAEDTAADRVPAYEPDPGLPYRETLLDVLDAFVTG